MSRYIATRAIRGANLIVQEAQALLDKALAEKGPQTPVAFPNTAYYLPLINGLLGQEVSTLEGLVPVMARAQELLHPLPASHRWTPYLGETLDSGIATLLAEETIMAVRYVYGEQPERMPGFHLAGSFTSPDEPGKNGAGHLNGPIDDVQLRAWGIQLVDGRMPGFAAIVGCAKSNEVAVKIVRELQRRNILIFLAGNVNGRSIIHQLQEEGVEMGYDTYIVPFGTDTISAIYALGFATRSALTFGGLKGGQAREVLLYNRARVFAFVLALGEVDDLKYATAAGAISYGFPVIADTIIPQILPTGVTQYEHVISMPFDQIPGANDLERAEKLVQKCIEVRGVKVRVTEVPIPVPYGSAFEGEVVRKNDMRVEFGGKYSRAFEYLRMAGWDEVEDGKIQVVGPDISTVPEQGHMDMGIVVDVAGRKMQKDFEPVLERQIHYFVNGASGVQHIGQRDIAWIRISKAAAEKGFNLRHFGDILHARLHADFGAIVDKAQVTIYTDPPKVAEWLERARAAYNERNVRMAGMKDEDVPEFYTCTLCQSFAPTHVCIVSPERVGLCGAYSFLDCKASYEINPTGPNQPIVKGRLIDPEKGYWEGLNAVAVKNSQGKVNDVAMYSIMENPMTACGCFECIVMLIPETNGVMVVSREDTSMTPAGMTFSTLAGMAGGGLQTPGVMGVGKYFLTSPKFIKADGGFKRVVWMSSFLKESMADALKEVAEREGVPDLVDRIADERVATTVDELSAWLEEHGHPALMMPPIF
ncbi:MAG: CO dehydrogenase/CO-methylating acetyl-CoA synthase complex subunit beta [Anaerolineae bacterium]|nr:CO dehydrogenase/CO-methylating acetyl-CoA synthase complex subunit beta [Anaerolineae bacterium]